MAKKKYEGFIRRTYEHPMVTEVESPTVPKHCYRNLVVFCQTVGLNESEVRSTINRAKNLGHTSATYEDWNFSWKSIDQYRDWLKSHGVKVGNRMGRIHGWIPVDPANFTTANKPFAELLVKFMNRGD